jgi:hypothetical protein
MKYRSAVIADLAMEQELSNKDITKKSLAVGLWLVLGIVYFPFYFISYILRVVARLILGLSYIGMLQFSMGKDILKSLFCFYDHKI